MSSNTDAAPFFAGKKCRRGNAGSTKLIGTQRRPTRGTETIRKRIAECVATAQPGLIDFSCNNLQKSCEPTGVPKTIPFPKTIVTAPLELVAGWPPTAPNPSHRPVVRIQIKEFPVRQHRVSAGVGVLVGTGRLTWPSCPSGKGVANEDRATRAGLLPD